MSKTETAGILTRLQGEGYRPDGSWHYCENRNEPILQGDEQYFASMKARFAKNPDLESAFCFATKIGVNIYLDSEFRTSCNCGYYIRVAAGATDEDIIKYLI